MANVLPRKYHRSGRLVNAKVRSAKERKNGHLEEEDPIGSVGMLLPDPAWVDEQKGNQLSMLNEYVKLVENKQEVKAQTPVSLEGEPKVDLALVAEKLKQEKAVNDRNTMLSGLMFAGSAGLLLATGASGSAEAVKLLATGYAVATASTVLASKAVGGVKEEGRERIKQTGQIIHGVGDATLSTMIGTVVTGAVSGVILTIAPNVGRDISDRMANINARGLSEAAIYAKNYYFDRTGVLHKFDSQLTRSFGNVVSRTLLTAVIAQSTGLLVGSGVIGASGYLVAYTLGRTLLDIYYDYDYSSKVTPSQEGVKKAEDITKKDDETVGEDVTKKDEEKDLSEAGKIARTLEQNNKADKKPPVSHKPSLATFVLKRLSINASICAAGFVSPYAASIASRTLPVLFSTILSSSFAEGVYSKIKDIHINISQPVSNFLSKLFSEKGTSTVADKSIQLQ